MGRYGGFISCELASCPRTYSKRCDKNVSTISTTYSSKAPTPILELSHHLQFQASVCDILRLFSQGAPPGPIFYLAPFSCSAQKFISRQKWKNYVANFFLCSRLKSKKLWRKKWPWMKLIKSFFFVTWIIMRGLTLHYFPLYKKFYSIILLKSLRYCVLQNSFKLCSIQPGQ